MCLAIPGKVKSIKDVPQRGKVAVVEFGEIIKEVNLEMLPNTKVGDYVLVHVGVAISKVDEQEARKIFEYLTEIGELGELEDVNKYLPKDA